MSCLNAAFFYTMSAHLLHQRRRGFLGPREEHMTICVRVARDVSTRHQRRHPATAWLRASAVRKVVRSRDDEGR